MKTINQIVIGIICFLVVYGCQRKYDNPVLPPPTKGVVEDPEDLILLTECDNREKNWLISCNQHSGTNHIFSNSGELCLKKGQKIKFRHCDNGCSEKNHVVNVTKRGPDLCSSGC